ncbi:MAG: DNA-directed RNA polymerase [Promethearchaeota archaeon]
MGFRSCEDKKIFITEIKRWTLRFTIMASSFKIRSDIAVYFLTTIADTIRVPPSRFGENISEVILDICRAKYENTVSPDIGMLVVVVDIQSVSAGRIIPGHGDTFHDVVFTGLTFRPLDGEVVEGEVVEATKFGVFIRVGCTDALCHVSQLADEYFSLGGKAKQVLTGRESGRTFQLGDRVRAQIITATMDHVSMKIAVTMRKSGLGPERWGRKAAPPPTEEVVDDRDDFEPLD